MTDKDFFAERRRAELPVFMSVLHALPAEALAYKPHERSPSAEQVVWTLVKELRNCLEVVARRETEWSEEAPPPLSGMLELFERQSNDLTRQVGALDEVAWQEPARFFYKGKLVLEQPVGQFLWFLLFNGIHHRGQLSAYLRPMGGVVPAIYGPSADTA